MQYRIEKEGAMHKVVSNFTGLTQYKSMSRKQCRWWIEDNTQTETNDEDENAQA